MPESPLSVSGGVLGRSAADRHRRHVHRDGAMPRTVAVLPACPALMGLAGRLDVGSGPIRPGRSNGNRSNTSVQVGPDVSVGAGPETAQ